MSQAAPTGHIKQRTIIARLNLWLLVLVGVLMAFQALVANDQVTNGRKLSALQQERDDVTVKMAEEQQQIDAISSLSYIRQQAMGPLGMEPVGKNIRYLPLHQ